MNSPSKNDYIKIYTPSNLIEYNIHKNKIKEMEKWRKEFIKKNYPYLIISGPSGCGKTLLVNLFLEKHNYDIVNYAPNENLTHKQEIVKINSILNSSNVMSMFGNKPKAILFEDLEIGSTSDRGYLNDIIQILNSRKDKKGNLAIFTINSNIKYKKKLEIENTAKLVILDKPSSYEIFQQAKLISNKMALDIEDYKLQFLANKCQGDIRSLQHHLSIHLNKKKEIEINLTDTCNISEHWNIVAKKDIEFIANRSLDKFLNPNISTSFEIYEGIYYTDQIFGPANIFENCRKLLDNISTNDKERKDKSYLKIINCLCDWSIFENYSSDPTKYFGNEYSITTGIAQPLNIIRNMRKDYSWSNVPLKTSNIFSRISQSSFNWRSICELSKQLGITRNEFHYVSYIIAMYIQTEDKNNKLINFINEKQISSVDLDRIIRYNCISTELEKKINSKFKTQFRKKILNKNKPSKKKKT